MNRRKGRQRASNDGTTTRVVARAGQRVPYRAGLVVMVSFEESDGQRMAWNAVLRRRLGGTSWLVGILPPMPWAGIEVPLDLEAPGVVVERLGKVKLRAKPRPKLPPCGAELVVLLKDDAGTFLAAGRVVGATRSGAVNLRLGPDTLVQTRLRPGAWWPASALPWRGPGTNRGVHS